jgi:type IV pilus assembly protein PilM
MLASKSKGIVGLDIEAGSVAAAEVHLNGGARLVGSGMLALPPGVFREGEITDLDALVEALKELFAREKLSRNVRLGVANHRVAVRTLDLPGLEKPEEIESAIRFQAQDHIPMPLDQAVLEHQVIRYYKAEADERRMQVVVVAARRDMVGSMLTALRKAGLRPVGIDLSAFGMIRGLRSEHDSPPPGLEAEAQSDAVVADSAPVEGSIDAPAAIPDPDEGLGPDLTPARLYCNLGDITNLAVAHGEACEFTRVSAFGMEGIAQRLSERRGLTLDHARQWLAHVGLESPTDEIEGDPETVAAAREVLAEGVAKLVDELRLSLEFHGAQEGAHRVESIVVCGPGTTVPGLVARLQRELGYGFEIGRPRALGHLDDTAAARLTLPYGLALEE